MITYRSLKSREDILKAEKLCIDNSMEFPVNTQYVIGAFDNDDLVGVCGFNLSPQIGPLINISGHGHVSDVLAESVFAVASLTYPVIHALTENAKLINLYEKKGFVLNKNTVRLSKSL